jgi:superfamily I DNA/RNA helicase
MTAKRADGESAFDGVLLTAPFGSETLRSVALDRYGDLLSDYDDPGNVLVLTGTPTSTGTFRELLQEECPGAAVPNVSSVVVHATDVINRRDDDAVLSDTMRRELVHRFLDDQEWDSEYLDRAATQESFAGDVAQLLETATWQNATLDSTPELRELATVRDEFREWLDANDHLERGQMITEAISLLESAGESESLVDVDAVLVVEFEEFAAPDREYLQTLSAGRELVCIAERDASIRRTWTETGTITDHVSFTEQQSVESIGGGAAPSATAAYFARGDVRTDIDTGSVSVMAAETPDRELERIANEIERLREDQDISYDDIAVAFKQRGDEVIDAIQAFSQSNIPTRSATVIGFGDDPAVREVLQVVWSLSNETSTEPEFVGGTEEVDLESDFLRALVDMEHLGNALRRWATETDLKDRIASNSEPLTARTRFGNLGQVFNMADFLEETAFLEATWDSLATMLTRAHEYAPQQNQTSAIDRDGGVRVDHVGALKNGDFDVVFLPHLTDTQYPGRFNISRLFPRERVLEMPDFPAVTQVEDPGATFRTESTESSSPVRRYHVEHARRVLAVGAASANERLYLSLHTHEDTALDERVQPSRFIADAFRDLPWLREATDGPITTEKAAEEFLLARVDRAISEVHRAHSQDVTVSLDDLETEFAEIQSLLEESGSRGDELRDAFRARLDFAAGRVTRE